MAARGPGIARAVGKGDVLERDEGEEPPPVLRGQRRAHEVGERCRGGVVQPLPTRRSDLARKHPAMEVAVLPAARAAVECPEAAYCTRAVAPVLLLFSLRFAHVATGQLFMLALDLFVWLLQAPLQI